MSWTITKVGKEPVLRSPILVEGLPGIGNVGKVAVDFLVDELKATKYCDFHSRSFPHSVFVNEKNLVELPMMTLYYKKMPKAKHDLLFLVGDIQPIDEVSCYEFCELILDMLKLFGGTDVITTGGIGLQQIPTSPKVFITGANKKVIDEYKKGVNVSSSLYGVVGPIVGVAGVLLGIAPAKKMRAVGLLVETFGHPMYLGVKGAKELVLVIKTKLGLKLNLKRMEEEIEGLEKEVLRKTKELTDVGKKNAIERVKGKLRSEISYIG